MTLQRPCSVMAGHSPVERRASCRTPYLPAIHALRPPHAYGVCARSVAIADCGVDKGVGGRDKPGYDGCMQSPLAGASNRQ
jgi:hypothetical protein